MRNSNFVESSSIHEGPRIRKQAERDMQVPCFMEGKGRNDYEPRLVMTLIVKLCNHLSRWTDPEIIDYHGRTYVSQKRGVAISRTAWHSFSLGGVERTAIRSQPRRSADKVALYIMSASKEQTTI